MMAWHEETIGKNHDLEAFDCHNNMLNEFLIRHARRSHEWGGLKTFLAIDDQDNRIMGFYSLGPVSIEPCTQNDERWGVSRLKQLGVRLEYLAVDRRVQRRGLGGQLLLAAGRRCLLASIKPGGVLLLMAVREERAAKWFATYGAIPLSDMPRFLVLPIASIEAALRGARKRKEQMPELFEPDF
jgi:GNAT superfamily N-acetyltransferase